MGLKKLKVSERVYDGSILHISEFGEGIGQGFTVSRLTVIFITLSNLLYM